jgi:hypothetical protein
VRQEPGVCYLASDTAIATDSTGGVHISYRNASASRGYATNAAGPWTTAIP